VHLVGFIVRIYHGARSPERQIKKKDAGCTHEIQSRIAMAQTEPNKNKALLTSKLNFSVKQKPTKR